MVVVLLCDIAIASAHCRDEPPFPFSPVEGMVTKAGKSLASVIDKFYADHESVSLASRSSSGPTDEAVITGFDATGAWSWTDTESLSLIHEPQELCLAAPLLMRRTAVAC
jgi:hypothetical protein